MRGLFVLLALVACAAAEGAMLLSTKELVDVAVARDRTFAIKYSIFNIGDAAATDVTLEDTHNEAQGYSVVSGLTTVKFAEIAPSANVTHVVVASLDEDLAQFVGGKVTYFNGQDLVTSYTSAPRPHQATDASTYSRHFDGHFVQWGIFLALCVVPIGIPFFLASSSGKSKQA